MTQNKERLKISARAGNIIKTLTCKGKLLTDVFAYVIVITVEEAGNGRCLKTLLR